jgi:hypothetical protein
MNTIQLAENARVELDSFPDECFLGEDQYNPGWGLRGVFLDGRRIETSD